MTETSAELDRIEAGIRQLKVDFDRYFNGALPIPPEELRTELSGRLRRIRQIPMPLLVDRFRLSSLEARYNSLSELCNRKLRDLERGVLNVPAATQGPDPYAGVIIDGRQSRQEALALYHELYGASGRSQKTDFGSFLDFIDRQASQIRKKTGCPTVQFRVISSKGRLSLKARPVRATS